MLLGDVAMAAKREMVVPVFKDWIGSWRVKEESPQHLRISSHLCHQAGLPPSIPPSKQNKNLNKQKVLPPTPSLTLRFNYQN